MRIARGNLGYFTNLPQLFDWLNFIADFVSANKVLLQSSRQAKYGLQMKLELFLNSEESLSGAGTTNFLF